MCLLPDIANKTWKTRTRLSGRRKTAEKRKVAPKFTCTWTHVLYTHTYAHTHTCLRTPLYPGSEKEDGSRLMSLHDTGGKRRVKDVFLSKFWWKNSLNICGGPWAKSKPLIFFFFLEFCHGSGYVASKSTYPACLVFRWVSVLEILLFEKIFHV